MRILHLEDNPEDAELIRRLIEGEWPECRITCVSGREQFVGELDRGGYDVVLSDFALPCFDGLEALRVAKERAPATPFIFVSGNIGEARAIDAVRMGAEDYVLKDRINRIVTAITRAVRDTEERNRRRVAERRIREQAEMLNQANEAIYITDLDNRIIYWNAGAERLIGWSTEDALGKTAEQLTDPVLLPQITTARRETFEKGQWHGEIRLQTSKGETLILESRQTLIRDEAGRPKARLCINSDITERKRLEEQFLRAQRMENLGLLAAGIAHDLNNMLAPILLAAPMLRDHVDDASALKLLETLERSAERGSQLVRQILSFAHGVSGDNQLLQVKHLLRDIVGVIAGTFPKSIRLEDYVPSDLWPIKGNATQIHQVLLNLCVNARDAMPAGGALRVIGENRVLDAEAAAKLEGGRPGAFLVLQIEDTGSGIPPEIMKHIWEPFFTTKEPGHGTGLGLSTVRGIVESHQGFVQVTSTVGIGSCFRVFLPAAETGLPVRPRAAARLLPQGRGEMILVVDDEQQIRDMTSAILGRHGYRVLLAADGTEAAALFAQRAAEIRLVISDLHMPNLDGAMLGRALRRINPATKMLVVSGMVSALGNRGDYRTDEFADDLLLKPFKAETLLEKVGELLNRSVSQRSRPQ
ncbi:MAG TPA: response regulator [Opitutaceae bacterium]|nr:response regulator [Opitutaceae bacterium]